MTPPLLGDFTFSIRKASNERPRLLPALMPRLPVAALVSCRHRHTSYPPARQRIVGQQVVQALELHCVAAVAHRQAGQALLARQVVAQHKGGGAGGGVGGRGGRRRRHAGHAPARAETLCQHNVCRTWGGQRGR